MKNVCAWRNEVRRLEYQGSGYGQLMSVFEWKCSMLSLANFGIMVQGLGFRVWGSLVGK